MDELHAFVRRSIKLHVVVTWLAIILVTVCCSWLLLALAGGGAVTQWSNRQVCSTSGNHAAGVPTRTTICSLKAFAHSRHSFTHSCAHTRARSPARSIPCSRCPVGRSTLAVRESSWPSSARRLLPTKAKHPSMIVMARGSTRMWKALSQQSAGLLACHNRTAPEAAQLFPLPF